MTRISENQSTRVLISNTLENKRLVGQFGKELSSGYKVELPGDSGNSGVVSQHRQSIDKIDSFTTTISEVKSYLQFQDDALGEVSDLLIRAKEIAAQAANETNGGTSRAQLAGEVLQIRDHIVSIANNTYQGRYVWGGAADNTPPYFQSTYTTPATGEESERWVLDVQPGRSNLRTVQITDSLSLTVNSAASGLFDTAIQGMERLGRSLSGYTSTPASGTTDGGGVTYTLPAQLRNQTQDIKAAMDLLDVAREQQIIPERVNIGGKQRRIETGESLLTLTKNNAEDVLSRLQNVDEAEAASGLQLAQNALQASYTVTARVLRLTILDYI